MLLTVFKISKSEISNVNYQLNASVFNFLHNFYSTKPVIDILFNENCLDTSNFLKTFLTYPSFTSTVEINSFQNQKSKNRRKKMFNIIILRDFENFNELTQDVTKFNFNFKGFFTLNFMRIEQKNLKHITSFAWQNFMHNLNIVKVERNGKFSVWTFHPFHDEKCGDTSPLLFSFSKDENFPNKIKNLHKCPLRIPLFHYSPAVEFKENSILSGIEGDLLVTIQKALNFTLVNVKLEEFEKWGDIKLNL